MSKRVETLAGGARLRRLLKKLAHRRMRQWARRNPEGAPQGYPYFTPWWS